MECINATSLHRKSGQWGTQLSLPVKQAGHPSPNSRSGDPSDAVISDLPIQLTEPQVCDRPTLCHPERSRGTCGAPSPLTKAGCPIQARFWLEWDTTALDAPFLSLGAKPRDLQFSQAAPNAERAAAL